MSNNICIYRPFNILGYQIGEFIETQCVRVLSPLELFIVLVNVVQIRLPDITSKSRHNIDFLKKSNFFLPSIWINLNYDFFFDYPTIINIFKKQIIRNSKNKPNYYMFHCLIWLTFVWSINFLKQFYEKVQKFLSSSSSQIKSLHPKSAYMKSCCNLISVYLKKPKKGFFSVPFRLFVCRRILFPVFLLI